MMVDFHIRFLPLRCRSSPHERSDMRVTTPGYRFAHPGYVTVSDAPVLVGHTLARSGRAISQNVVPATAPLIIPAGMSGGDVFDIASTKFVKRLASKSESNTTAK